MADNNAYMSEHKGRVFDFSVASGWVVMAGHNAFMPEHRVNMFDLIIA
jgi:hypothetical protein